MILDEIGRGTATFDGLSLAWAVAEHLASNRARAAEDDLRHALPRADGPRRRAPGRRQLPRRGARVQGRHRVPAQDRRRPIRSQLRHSGRAARGAAAGGRRGARRRSSRRSSRTNCSAAAGPASAARRRRPAAARAVPGRRPTRTRSSIALRALDVDRLTPLEALNLLADLKREAERMNAAASSLAACWRRWPPAQRAPAAPAERHRRRAGELADEPRSRRWPRRVVAETAPAPLQLAAEDRRRPASRAGPCGAVRTTRLADVRRARFRRGVRFHDGRELTAGRRRLHVPAVPRSGVRLRPQGRLSRSGSRSTSSIATRSRFA